MGAIIVATLTGRSQEEVEYKAKKMIEGNAALSLTNVSANSAGVWSGIVISETLKPTKMELPEAIKQVLEIVGQFDLAQQNQIMKATREQMIASREEQLKKLDEQSEAIKDALSNL
jgi:hypothetical protein